LVNWLYVITCKKCGYISTEIWLPGFLLYGKRAKKVLHNLIEAHVLAYEKIKELDDVDSDADGKSIPTNINPLTHVPEKVLEYI
jgi:hypothetical protein